MIGLVIFMFFYNKYIQWACIDGRLNTILSWIWAVVIWIHRGGTWSRVLPSFFCFPFCDFGFSCNKSSSGQIKAGFSPNDIFFSSSDSFMLLQCTFCTEHQARDCNFCYSMWAKLQLESGLTVNIQAEMTNPLKARVCRLSQHISYENSSIYPI